VVTATPTPGGSTLFRHATLAATWASLQPVTSISPDSSLCFDKTQRERSGSRIDRHEVDRGLLHKQHDHQRTLLNLGLRPLRASDARVQLPSPQGQGTSSPTTHPNGAQLTPKPQSSPMLQDSQRITHSLRELARMAMVSWVCVESLDLHGTPPSASRMEAEGSWKGRHSQTL
jgi:hypothetical protein